MVVTQEFVNEFFKRIYFAENTNKITPKEFIDFLMNGVRHSGKPRLFGLIFQAFLDMLQTYKKSNEPNPFNVTSCTSTIASSDIHFTTTGVPPDWQVRFNDITKALNYEFVKFPKEPRSKKAKFKQSKFDQINSFGKKNVNSR